MVNAYGKRIIDETRYGAAVGHAMIQDHGGKEWIDAAAAEGPDPMGKPAEFVRPVGECPFVLI